jgi:GNAT superfamily N-acetyltransferase
MGNFQFSLSELDEQRFGIRTATARSITIEYLAELDSFCHDNKVQLSIARIDTNHLDVVQKMEGDGYRLMDTLVYYAFKYAKNAIPEDTSTYVIRPVQSDDLDVITTIATESFKGYYGHYHADPRLPDNKCDEVYIDWAAKSVTSQKIADEVMVVVGDNQLNGFATLRSNSIEEGEGVLFGVAPHAQGQGIYRTMMISGMKWCQERGAERMVVSTQINNIAVQKVWARLGFEMNHSYYTLHKWFNN